LRPTEQRSLRKLRAFRSAREELAVRYVGRLIRLAFLAPEIVDSIVEGRQPTTLTAEALTRRIELPLSWGSQRTALNVE
jgi:hypothetical protein